MKFQPAIKLKILLIGAMLFITACTNSGITPLPTVTYVDLNQFMGRWFVHAYVPTPFDKNAFNPIEDYQLNDDGTIKTIYSYRKGGPEGTLKKNHSTGIVTNPTSNASWEMRLTWPLKSDFQIAFLDPEYQHTIVGRNKRDYVWIMSRQPDISSQHLDMLMQRVTKMGYSLDHIVRAKHPTH